MKVDNILKCVVKLNVLFPHDNFANRLEVILARPIDFSIMKSDILLIKCRAVQSTCKLEVALLG